MWQKDVAPPSSGSRPKGLPSKPNKEFKMEDQDQYQREAPSSADSAGEQVSQETPEQDSGLQTPQADQPVPTERERDGEGQVTQAEGQQDESASEPPARDQVAEEQQREVERQEQIQRHAERTGGGDVTTTERVEQREEHLRRTNGEGDSQE